MLNNNRVLSFFGVFVIGLLMALAYQTTLVWLYSRYMAADTYYSHGFFVPLVSLYFLYKLKEQFITKELKMSKAGFIVILFSVILHIVGTVLYVFSVSGFSLFFLVIGVSLFLFGSERTKVAWFPLLFLIFMFPLPLAVIELISFPLKIFAAKAGVWLVGLSGVPVYGEGFNIFIPAGRLLVGNPCSGLRSLIAFLAIGAILAYVSPFSINRKLILFAFAAPVALLSNIIRIPILVLVSHHWGLEAARPETLVHQGSGILVFVLGFLMLLFLEKVLKWQT